MHFFILNKCVLWAKYAENQKEKWIIKKWEKNVFFLERNEIKCDLVRYKVKRWLKKMCYNKHFMPLWYILFENIESFFFEKFKLLTAYAPFYSSQKQS